MSHPSPAARARTRVKFCGVTRAEDALAAARLGADAVGFVFAAGSPRFIAPAAAAMIRGRLPPLIHTVALFRNADPQFVQEVLAACEPHLLQFHGEETRAFCESFGRPYLRAVPMRTPQDLARWSAEFAGAAALLLDGHASGEAGGQGRAFDWSALPPWAKPIILAGGLTPDNVAGAVRQVRPYGVDVSSGIEAAPGIKDPERMQRFIEQVQEADAE